MKKIILNIIFLILTLSSTVFSQNYQWNPNPYYYNLTDPHGYGLYYIGTFPMSTFYIKARDIFNVATGYAIEDFKIWVNVGDGMERFISFDGDQWQTYCIGDDFYQYWTPGQGDRFHTVGNYFYMTRNVNHVLAVNVNSGLAKVLAPPGPSSSYEWAEIWSNNGSGYINEVPIMLAYEWEAIRPGNFSTPYNWIANSTGQDILFILTSLGQAFLLHMDDDGIGNITWTKVWDNDGNDHIGDWEMSEPFLGDRYSVADFDGDRYDEVIVFNSMSMKAMILKYQNSTNNWTTLWYNNASGKIGSWSIPLWASSSNSLYMYSGDMCIRYEEDHKHELVNIENWNTGKVIIQQFHNNTRVPPGWDVLWNSTNIPGLWTGEEHDNYHIGNYQLGGWNDRHEELMLFNTQENGRAKILMFETNTDGCPWLYVYNNDTTGYQPENNLLHRSEFTEYAGTDIKDLYKLNIEPEIYNNQLHMQIAETEHDYNYFDNIKLYAVDHPTGTKIGITENKNIVMYYSDAVTSSDNAYLNGTSNITSYIQYSNPGKKTVSGIDEDSIYAHYDSTSLLKAFENIKRRYSSSQPDSFAIIGEIGEGTEDDGAPSKTYAGQMAIYTRENTYTRPFARRENISEVIIPFAGESDSEVDHVDIDWYRDYTLNYLSVVPIMYTGFNVNELTLAYAEHSIIGDISSQLRSIDLNYAELDTTAIIILGFNKIAEPEPGWVRNYLIETNGRYTHEGVDGTSKNTKVEKVIVKAFKLYDNYPNPFNPVTNIKFDVPKTVNVNIKIYDILGREVTTLVNNEMKNPGQYNIKWNASNYASGVYIYRIQADDYVNAKKMVLVK